MCVCVCVCVFGPQLEEGKLYSVAEWSVCLINKANLTFMSIEQHFEIGHLTFELTEAHVKGRVRPSNHRITDARREERF
jgi:hypothetical protein